MQKEFVKYIFTVTRMSSKLVYPDSKVILTVVALYNFSC